MQKQCTYNRTEGKALGLMSGMLVTEHTFPLKSALVETCLHSGDAQLLHLATHVV